MNGSEIVFVELLGKECICRYLQINIVCSSTLRTYKAVHLPKPVTISERRELIHGSTPSHRSSICLACCSIPLNIQDLNSLLSGESISKRKSRWLTNHFVGSVENEQYSPLLCYACK